MLMKRPLQLVQLDLPQSVNLLGVMTRSQNSYFAKYLSFLSSSVVLRECVVCVECSLSCKIRHLSHDLAVCRDFFFFAYACSTQGGYEGSNFFFLLSNSL